MGNNLKKCHSCGKDVAANAYACPHCGARNPGRNIGCMVAGITVGIILMIVGVVMQIIGNNMM